MNGKTLLLIFALCFSFLPGIKAETCSEDCVAKIGDTKYASINEAVKSVTGNEAVTIEILKDSTDESGVFLGKGTKNITIDFNNHSVTFTKDAVGSTGTENQALHLEKGNTVVLKNGTIVIANVPNEIKMGIQNYCDLTLEDITFDASITNMGYAISNNAGEINFKGKTNIYASSKKDAVAFDVYWWSQYYPEGPKVTIDTTGEIKGNVELANDGKNIVVGKNNSLTIKNVKHTGKLIVEGNDAVVLVSGGTFTDEKVKDYIDELSKVTKQGDFYVVGDNKEIEATIDDGTIEFASEAALDNSYRLIVVPATKEEINESDKTITKKINNDKKVKDLKVINIFDIEVQDSLGDTVEMKNGKFVISLPIKEDMQKYDIYKVVYIKDGNVMEQIDAKLVNGKIVFNTTHLSTYAVVGMNKVAENPNFLTQTNTSVTEENPKTGDNIALYLIICSLSLISFAGLNLYTKRKKIY